LKVAIAGGGLAGLSAAWMLAEEGYEVHVYESRQFPGGRAASYAMPRNGGGKERLDNSQHILLRCCSNLLDLYRRIGVDHLIDFYSDYTFLEPGGRSSTLKPGSLPAPLHMIGGFLKLKFLSLGDKLAIARGMRAVQREYARGPLLDSETMESWLKRHGQTEGTIRGFWEPVLISAVNANLGEISAWQGIRLVHLGFLASDTNYQMGVPRVLLGDLHAAEHWTRKPNLHLHFGAAVTGFDHDARHLNAMNLAAGRVEADVYVSALPFPRLGALLPALRTGMEGVAQSPIAGIHLRFDRKVTDLPHAALLGRTMQWFFSREDGHMLSLVVSAAHALETMKKEEVVALAVREMADFLPDVSEAKLLDSWVIRETHATFVASPGFEAKRPGPRTEFSNLFLAGEWTNTGWPSTMEGAVISGYRAAEAICACNGQHRRFVI
jgi:squalene-associated FAD-dependent desaturase